MVGVFAEWQPQYAERGIATFPVENKKPAVRRYLKMGVRDSKKLVDRFSEHDAIGLACHRNRITVIDVDTPDERLLVQALEEFGPTPFIVRSGSGNHQAWYRNSGEGRHIRPDPSRPIDILGDGFVVAPPSRSERGNYEIVAGSLDDLERLPRLARYLCPKAENLIGEFVDLTSPGRNLLIEGRILQGRRNKELWRECMRQAHNCTTKAELEQKAVAANARMFDKPLDADELLKVVASAWRTTKTGDNLFGRGGKTVLANARIDQLAAHYPDALLLLTVLKRHHWGRPEFAVANDMHEMLGMTRKRLAAARKYLEEIGELILVQAPGPLTGPGIYRFSGGQN